MKLNLTLKLKKILTLLLCCEEFYRFTLHAALGHLLNSLPSQGNLLSLEKTLHQLTFKMYRQWLLTCNTALHKVVWQRGGLLIVFLPRTSFTDVWGRQKVFLNERGVVPFVYMSQTVSVRCREGERQRGPQRGWSCVNGGLLSGRQRGACGRKTALLSVGYSVSGAFQQILVPGEFTAHNWAGMSY